MTKIRVNLIGAGRVGRSFLGLLRALPEYAIQDVLSGRFASAQEAVKTVGAGRAVESYSDLRAADVWILTVPDSRISSVAGEIAKSCKEQVEDGGVPVAFHCSGFYGADKMAALQELGWRLASVHPVLTFSDPETAIEHFAGTYCGIEGDAPALETVRSMLTAMGAQPFLINSDSKSIYHAAAVISNNFTVVLQGIARDAWREAGVGDDIATALNATLLRATCDNVTALGPWPALTGPAARGDDAVVRQQGRDVARWDPAVGRVYRELSLLAQKMAGDERAHAALSDEDQGDIRSD